MIANRTMTPRHTAIASVTDARVGALARVGGGEGFATYVAKFAGNPAAIIDCGTLAGVLEELDSEDTVEDAVTVLTFTTELARHEYVSHMRRKTDLG